MVSELNQGFLFEGFEVLKTPCIFLKCLKPLFGIVFLGMRCGFKKPYFNKSQTASKNYGFLNKFYFGCFCLSHTFFEGLKHI